ncbi:MAG TPA: hypothetical protein VLN49_17305, partial [Gemmatimonadaceae bacterium]|nr:hypothetical protein [Gemmatimonadaceae bacterium]
SMIAATRRAPVSGAREDPKSAIGYLCARTVRIFACTPCVRGDDEFGRASAFAPNVARGGKCREFTLDLCSPAFDLWA